MMDEWEEGAEDETLNDHWKGEQAHAKQEQAYVQKMVAADRT
jgi:hypothetical protein